MTKSDEEKSIVEIASKHTEQTRHFHRTVATILPFIKSSAFTIYIAQNGNKTTAVPYIYYNKV